MKHAVKSGTLMCGWQTTLLVSKHPLLFVAGEGGDNARGFVFATLRQPSRTWDQPAWLYDQVFHIQFDFFGVGVALKKPARRNMMAMNFSREPPQKLLVDMNPHRNDVHQRVPYENSYPDDRSVSLSPSS